MLTIQELDRLISKTELTPTSKQVLRKVRKAMLSGNSADPIVGNYKWSVTILSVENQPVTVSFRMKRDRTVNT